VILAQNTFGLAADLEHLMAIAAGSRATVIEDCAHGFGGTYRSRPNGTVADASFFSSQWSKPFSTGIGGFSAVRDAALARKVREIERRLERPAISETLMLRGLLFARRRLLGHTGYWRGLRLYRWLSEHNIVIGSSRGEECAGTTIPKGYAKALSAVQARKGIRELGTLRAKLEHQRRIAHLYLEGLGDLDIRLPVQPDYATHTFLRFPILARERSPVMARAVEHNLILGDWFLSPLHPIAGSLQAWGYQWGSNPVAERVSRHVVNLPTQTDIDETTAYRIVRFVHELRRHFEGVT
jgi:perosamine synthetase